MSNENLRPESRNEFCQSGQSAGPKFISVKNNAASLIYVQFMITSLSLDKIHFQT